jgi:hypothetical protein
MYTWDAFGLYIPWPEWNTSHITDWCESEQHYGIEFQTRIKFRRSFGFLMFDVQVLGFGFFYCRQWDY